MIKHLIDIEDMGNIVVKKVALNVIFLPLTSVVPDCFLVNLLWCRHSRIRCLHALKEIVAKFVVILTSKLKVSNETLRILYTNNNRFVK